MYCLPLAASLFQVVSGFQLVLSIQALERASTDEDLSSHRQKFANAAAASAPQALAGRLCGLLPCWHMRVVGSCAKTLYHPKYMLACILLLATA